MLRKTVTMCFGCGKENPIGLRLDFRQEGDLFYAEFTPRREYQGWDGVLHGGIVSTLLDEVMANHVYHLGISAMTAELHVRFRRPVPLERTLRVVSRLKSQKHRLYELEGWIELDGKILASGEARMMEYR